MSKADAYDAAIGDSNNRQILLNAVRASQRAPMSFVGFGDVVANPVFSGSTGATFNFIPNALTGYSANPSISYGGGFASFQMNNLNHVEFAAQMHRTLDPRVNDFFRQGKWPKEIVDRMLIKTIVLSRSQYRDIHRRAAVKCAEKSQREIDICDQIEADKAAYWERCPRNHEESTEFFNTAREFCPATRYLIVSRTLRLLKDETYHRTYRSAEDILYYLGELIAAQNYSAQHYEPKVLLETPDGRHRAISLFVVKPGNPGPLVAAVQVNFNGEDFYIPKPQLGDIEEDRSLQVLDLVTTAIVLATYKDALPKSTNVNLISSR